MNVLALKSFDTKDKTNKEYIQWLDYWCKILICKNVFMSEILHCIEIALSFGVVTFHQENPHSILYGWL